MYIYLDETGEPILVKVEHEVVDKIEAVADDDERELVCEFRLLEEVLDLLGIVVVRLATDTLDFADLASTCRCLDVLEVHFRVLTEVNNGAKVIVQS